MSKQILHDIRVSYSNNDSAIQSIINTLNQQYIINSPDKYDSLRLTLIGTQTYNISDINFIYLSCENQIKIVYEGSNNLVAQHLSLVNLQVPFDIVLSNVSGVMKSEIQLFFGNISTS